MNDGCHCPYGISFVCRRNMISADLHADHYFVRLAKYHGTQSGHGFGQCQAGTSVQDAERLAGTFVSCQTARGMDAVLVAGRLAVKNGEMTGVKAGTLIRK